MRTLCCVFDFRCSDAFCLSYMIDSYGLRCAFERGHSTILIPAEASTPARPRLSFVRTVLL